MYSNVLGAFLMQTDISLGPANGNNIMKLLYESDFFQFWENIEGTIYWFAVVAK